MSLSELQEMVMDRDTWRAEIHGVTKSRTWLSDWAELNPLSETWFANIFCLSMGCLCILLIVISAVQKCFSLMYSGLFCLFLLPGLWCHLHEIISKSNVIKIFLMFSSRSFTLSGLRFKSNPFWIDFCDGIRCEWGAFQVVLVVKNLPANAEDVGNMGSVPGSGRCPGGGHGNLPQYSCLKNPMDRGAWRATVHRVAKSQIQLKRLNTQTKTRGGTVLHP